MEPNTTTLYELKVLELSGDLILSKDFLTKREAHWFRNRHTRSHQRIVIDGVDISRTSKRYITAVENARLLSLGRISTTEIIYD